MDIEINKNQQEIPIWKDVLYYEGLYYVSNFGQIKSIKSRIKAIKVHYKTGYCYVELYKENKPKFWPVHRLVMSAFVGLDKRDINHKDCNKQNNNLDNLEYCTRKENTRHAINSGVGKFFEDGENHPNAKLSNEDVKNIRSLFLDENYSVPKLSEMYNISKTQISRIIRYKSRIVK